MSKVDGAQILAKALKNEGVEKIFTLSGGHIYRVYQEAQKLGIETIDCRSEHAAAMTATAYAAATGKPAVLIATAGPGVTNLMTGVIDANMGDVPVLFLGGAACQMHDLCEVTQQYDCCHQLMMANTRWAARVEETSRIAEYIAKAFRVMLGSCPGPAYVELPMDILEINKVDEEKVLYPYRYRTESRIMGDPSAIEKAAELLVNAERPAMVIGNGAQYRMKNPDVFKELATYLQIPVSCGDNQAGRFYSTDADIFRVGGLAATQCDVLLLFNRKPDHWALEGFSRTAKLININHNSANVGLNMPLEVGLIGDSDAICEQILEVVKEKTDKIGKRAWVEALVAAKQENIEKLKKGPWAIETSPMHPGRAAYEITKFLNSEKGKDFNIVWEGGDCACWVKGALANLLETDHFGREFRQNDVGAIGVGAATVTGVYEATKRPICHLVGDGCFGEYTGECFTYAKINMPYLGVIFNDGQMAMIKAFSMECVPEEDHEVGQVITTGAGHRFAYEKIAESWGGYGKTVKKAEDIIPTLEEACESVMKGIPAIINLEIDFSADTISAGSVNLYKQLANPPKINF